MLNILLYVLLAAIVIFATGQASHFVDEFDKKSHISAAVLGGILLAVVTSLPEFATSITSTVRLDNPALAFGNVFGSNIFNILILALADLFFLKHLFFNKLRTQRRTVILVVVIYMMFGLPYLLGSFSNLYFDTFTIDIGIVFNVISVLIFVLYALSVLLMNNDESTQDDEDSDYSYGYIITRFILWSVVVVVAAYFITFVVNDIANDYNLSSSFVGAMFLGIATGLPEMTAVFTLVRLKNYEAALGNIVGSNIFNFTIIGVIDFVNYDCDIFNVLQIPETKENIFLLLILGLINSIILMLALYRGERVRRRLYVIPSILIVALYFVYIIFSV